MICLKFLGAEWNNVLSSQEVEESWETSAWNEFVLLSIGANLVGIHANHRHFDGASKVEVVVAQVVRGCLKLILVHWGSVINHFVQHWLGGGNSSLVRDQVEVKLGVTLYFNHSGINNCAWAGIQIICARFGEQAMLNVAIYKAVDNLRLVARGWVLKQIGDDFDLMFLDFGGHAWPTHTISVDDNLLRETLGVLLEFAHCLINEGLNNIGTLNCNKDLLDFSDWFAWELLSVFPSYLCHLLLVQFSIALCHCLRRSGTASNELAASVHNQVNSNKHGIFEVRKIHSVEILSNFSVHLLEQVREHSHCKLAWKLLSGDKLGRNTSLVEELFDSLFEVGVENNDAHNLAVLWINVWLYGIVVSFRGLWIRNLNPLRLLNSYSVSRSSLL